MGELKEKASHYSEAFDGAAPLADEKIRMRKAEKIGAVLEQEGVFSRPGLKILDIGCSFGIILNSLTPTEGLGVGVDIDSNMGAVTKNVTFVRTDAENLPFPAASFDVVICNHVYEHTDDPHKMFSEVRRVLTREGVCYFAGPNKYDLVEPHYGLPFLSWLPRIVADRYLRLTGKGECYIERPYSYPKIKKMLSGFDVVNYTDKILLDPVRYAATDVLPKNSMKRLIAIFLFKAAPFFFPGFVFILKQPLQDRFAKR